MNFPQKIHEYTFVNILQDIPARSEYAFAEYHSSNGKAICKLYQGKPTTKAARFLRNEAKVYSFVASFFGSHTGKIGKKTILIPKLIDHVSSETMSYILTEKVEGKLLAELSPEENVTVLEGLIQYFKKTQDNNGLADLPQRSSPSLLMLFVVYLLKLWVRKPAYIFLSSQTIAPVLEGFLRLGRNPQKSLVHRDLGGYNNIFISPSHISVIDFQISVSSHWLFEVANILTTRWYNDAFIQAFRNGEVVKNIRNDAEQKAIFKAFTLYATILLMASSTQKIDQKILQNLEWGLAL